MHAREVLWTRHASCNSSLNVYATVIGFNIESPLQSNAEQCRPIFFQFQLMQSGRGKADLDPDLSPLARSVGD